MSVPDLLLPVALGALLLAYANGANDNFKGVATLYGSGVLSYRTALGVGTVSTWLGSVAAIAVAGRLVTAFSGHGLVAGAVLEQPAFPVAVVTGAGLTVLAATRLGLPVSTTHALTGGLVGGGLAAGSLDASRLLATFVLPLAFSPVAAAALAGAGYLALRAARLRLGVQEDSCLCVEEPASGALLAPGLGARAAAVSLELPAPHLRLGNGQSCTRSGRYLPGLSAIGLLDAGHIASGLLVSFARGLNDAPKIAGVLLIGTAFSASPWVWSFVAVATAMGIGGLLSARRVARVMSLEITPLNEGQGFAANLVTSLLVLAASPFGLPVSTTHVSCGALFGIGAVTGQGRWRTIAAILGAWVVTLPAAAVAAAAVYLTASRL